MAGIEVAGLVLGALPLLLKSVDVYRDGFRRFGSAFKKRKHVEKLGRALLLQHQTLEELIKSVALGSGCEDVWALESDPVGYLNNPEVQAQVEEFLGPKHTIFLISELQANHEATKKVAKCISGLVPSYQVCYYGVRVVSCFIGAELIIRRVPQTISWPLSMPIKASPICWLTWLRESNSYLGSLT